MSKAIGFESEAYEFNYTFKDLILYALSVGASLADGDESGGRDNNTGNNDISLLYENSEDFAALPSFGVIPSLECLTGLVSGVVPGLPIDLSKVLHGEHFTEVLGPLSGIPIGSGRLVSRYRVVDVLDKGSGALIVIDVNTKLAETGQDLFRNQLSVFVVGSGGFGDRARSSDKIIPCQKPPPNDQLPSITLEFKTSPDQAALYRLNGDLNPLHIDPSFAALGGFDRPILHGLATLGIAIRQLETDLKKSERPERVKAFKARFAKPVYPGQTIITRIWYEGCHKAYFECKVKETGEFCITGGWATLAPRDASKV